MNLLQEMTIFLVETGIALMLMKCGIAKILPCLCPADNTQGTMILYHASNFND